MSKCFDSRLILIFDSFCISYSFLIDSFEFIVIYFCQVDDFLKISVFWIVVLISSRLSQTRNPGNLCKKGLLLPSNLRSSRSAAASRYLFAKKLSISTVAVGAFEKNDR